MFNFAEYFSEEMPSITNMEWTVKNVVPELDYKLLLTFENGEQKLFDMKPYLDFGVFRALKDPSMFNSVRVCFSSVAWDNNVDIDPETLYEDSVPVAIKE
ncbi:hypothetical protein AGMMS49525_05080 [Bacteroidia bacterium]|nr:hypothetical protein AGMMS49525_05080 [Bacteroidia bacterium]